MQSISSFLLFVLACSGADNHVDANDCSFLERARQLQAPIPSSTLYGETEASDFWQNHSSLLQQAWQEWELQQNLAALDETILLNNTIRDAVQSAWKDPRSEDQVTQEWKLVAPGVYKCQLLDPRYIHLIREHVDTASLDSGIPTRRPNGMNRYGLILYPNDTDGSVSLTYFNTFFISLLNRYIRPMARALFSEYISQENQDDVNAYAFTIRYKEGEDVSLQEHSDASLYTLNVNLNLPEEDYQGSSLYFVDNGEQHNVTFETRRSLASLGNDTTCISPHSRWIPNQHGGVVVWKTWRCTNRSL